MDRARLQAGLDALGIAWDETALTRFERFHALLDEANAHMDLTAVLEEEERVDRHDLDSVTVLSHLEIPQGPRVIDVGTGAGFPGIPLLILRPDLRMTFLDAQKKRILFLQNTLEALGLTAEVVHGRAEDAGRGVLRESFDYALSRAVAPMAVLQEYMLPFLQVGGTAVAWKGPKAAEEMESARRAAHFLGGRVQGTIAAPVPGRDWQHLLVVTQKIQGTPAKYPRKAGTPSKSPLA